MVSWQETPSTSPLRAFEIAKQLVERNEYPAAEIEAQVTWLIGQTLIRIHSMMLWSTLLDKAVQYNLDTQPMVAASLSELLEMATRITNIADQLKTLTHTSIQSHWISQNRHDVLLFCQAADKLTRDCLHYHGLG